MAHLGARLASVFLFVVAASRIVVAERVIVTVKDGGSNLGTPGDGQEDATTSSDNPQSRVDSFVSNFGISRDDDKRQTALANEEQHKQARIEEEANEARLRALNRVESKQKADEEARKADEKDNELKKVADDQFAAEKDKREDSEKAALEADTAAEKQHAIEKKKRDDDRKVAEGAMQKATEVVEAQKVLLGKLSDEQKNSDEAETARQEEARIARAKRTAESDIAQKSEEDRIAEEARDKANKEQLRKDREEREKLAEANEAAHHKLAELLPGMWATTDAKSEYSARWYRIAKPAGSKFPLSIAVMKSERSEVSPYVAGDIVKYTGDDFKNGDYGFVTECRAEEEPTIANQKLTKAYHLKVMWTVPGEIHTSPTDTQAIEIPVRLDEVELIEFARVKAKAIGELEAKDCLQDGCCEKSLPYNRKGGNKLPWKAGRVE